MCFSGSAPSPAPIPVAPAAAPQTSDPAVQAAQDSDRTRRLKAAAGNDTLVTGGSGITTPAVTGLKQAFGQ